MEIKGLITAMITPFDQNQKINHEATKRLVNKLIAHGVDGLFILGTNGEFHLLADDEKLEFAELVIKEVRHRVPVYVGTGGNSTQEVIELSKRMEAIGANALSVITPYFLVPTQKELINHYKKIADSVRIPIVLYNIPKNTGINLEVETVGELAGIRNIKGIKDSSGKIENIKKYIDVTAGKDFSVLSGSDSLILQALAAGSTGAIAATSNLITELDVSIYRNWLKGDFQQAQKAQNDIEPLRAVLKLGTVPSVLKKAVEMTGIPVGPPRFPVKEIVDNDIINQIKEVLAYYDIQTE